MHIPNQGGSYLYSLSILNNSTVPRYNGVTGNYDIAETMSGVVHRTQLQERSFNSDTFGKVSWLID